jgi:hypothetical protein
MWKIYCRTQRSQVTEHLSGNKHISEVSRLKDRPGRQSLNGESFVTSSSSGPSKFSTSVANLCKTLVSPDIRFKINNPEVRNFLINCTLTNPPDDSTLRKSDSSAMKKN